MVGDRFRVLGQTVAHLTYGAGYGFGYVGSLCGRTFPTASVVSASLSHRVCSTCERVVSAATGREKVTA